MITNYDEKFDILDISIFPNKDSIAVEEENGIVIFRDKNTNEITNIKIFGLTKNITYLAQATAFYKLIRYASGYPPYTNK